MTDFLDDDGYPTEAVLEMIAAWEIRRQADIDALWRLVRKLWWQDCFQPFVPGEETRFAWRDLGDDTDWYVCTLGWSGNESLLGALERNFLFWSLCWRASCHGGAYWFKIGNRIAE